MKNREDNRFPIEIISVVDGDGFKARALDGSNREIEVRLFAIDAPEGRQEYGRESTDHLRNLTTEGRFWLEAKAYDHYGRVIGIVYKDGSNAEHTLNYAMVRDGWAYWYSQYERPWVKPPDDETGIHETQNELGLREAEISAYMEEPIPRGFWVDPNAERPWDYKKRIREEAERRATLFRELNLGRTDAALGLIAQGVDFGDKDTQGNTYLHLAAGRDLVTVATALIQFEAQLDAKNNDGDSPLHLAVINQCSKTKELLIAAGADLNAANNSGSTPLQLEAEIESEKRTELLFQAFNEGRTDTLPRLIAAGVDAGAINAQGDTPMHLAARAGHIATMRALLDEGVNIDPRNARAETPLHIAVANGQTLSVDYLCNAGADLNPRNRIRNTPLHLAVINRHIEAKELLITAGADVTAENSVGSTPLQLEAETRRQVKRRLIGIGLVTCFVAVAAAIVVLFVAAGL